MCFMAMKKISSLLFLLIISLSLCSTSSAGREWKFVEKPAAMDLGATNKQEISSRKLVQHKNEALLTSEIHERLLRVNTKDYGRYDPSPTLVKPPFKLIPN
ncbi:hypothetical protein C5167_036177 [Papaver somniferum]|uniref:protein CASPARIAN STRIP INTEGRITY FACTOR 1-like n=1 Tax=Papaver somniferum TaxID=3469 RepID=UPI000E703B88|nr:protein CASPARIAN STRIP INTEGRITY FACTOR 1-like [Papaver somniferum]RZC87637.1 hypothetical protein C5167_036177 [Papaver somniferum]